MSSSRFHWPAVPSCAAALLLLSFSTAFAQNPNGNDFALYLTEAETTDQKQEMFEEAEGRPHFFRYLTIQSMEEWEGRGRSGVLISSVEPASGMIVAFPVTANVSLSLLREDPVSKPGEALAVTGRVATVDFEQNIIFLEESIVRHKDRTSPAIGRETLGEVNPRAVVYSYTEGPRPVLLQQRDVDLLEHRDEILGEGGPVAWVEFLEKKVAERNRQRAAEAAAREEGR